MADVPASVKGMSDILPPEVSKWHFLEEKARSVLESFAYREVRTPVLEYTPLFVRSVGEITDVVEKQMYTFDDRDGRSVSMRPEGTAPAVRAYLAASQWTKEPVTRWYYMGPMFRHERAQRGRLRQFHQVGAELFGVNQPTVDAEMIAMLSALLGELGIPASAYTITLNTLGEPEERAAYKDALVAYLTAHKDKLDEDSLRRLDLNPLRVLDSKSPEVQALIAHAPVIMEHLGDESRQRFARVREALGS
ncbi:MAG: histidine--tRNA ligase, partial [Deltaproteobacteria bacterium]|nr:histidine--tRNA ligase [Deltaproteobacteria bacterium]